MNAIKIALMAKCQSYIQQRIKNANELIQSVQEAANSDEKSSAGDKHETGRAMLHLEREKGEMQLAEANKLLNIYNAIDLSKSFEQVKTGALVNASNGIFFISISVGKMEHEGKLYWGIAPTAPLAQAMLNKKKGDTFSFNGKSFELLEIT